MKELKVGRLIVRHVKCDQCGLHLSYNKKKGQTEIICPKCKNVISIVQHKY